MTNKLEIWNKIKSVPKEFTKPIGGGRLKGMTDIKPQWRYLKMTEIFGPIGFGWYYEITSQWIEDGASGERCAFTNIDLYVKLNDEWSKKIVGNGGSSFVANEKHGPYNSDECFKMALTDALSVAMAKLGLASDIYMGYGGKYGNDANTYAPAQKTATQKAHQPLSDDRFEKAIKSMLEGGTTVSMIEKFDLTPAQREKLNSLL